MTEKLLYDIIGNLSNADAPLVFKGALITKLILAEQGYDKTNRATKDIDANWVGESPAMDDLVEVINGGLGKLSSFCVAEASRPYGKNQSAGIQIKDKNTGERVLSIDIDIKPLTDSKTYYYGETSIKGVLPNEILCDKISTISSDAVYKHRAKDLIDVYALSHCVKIVPSEIFDTAKATNRNIGSFDAFFNRRADVSHAYSKLKGIDGKPPFDDLYSYIESFVKPFAERNHSQIVWDSDSRVWSDVSPARVNLTRTNIDALYAENPIGDDDWFYNHPDKQAFEAVYFNPDSNAGGQYVIMTLPYDLIKDAARQTNDAQRFFEMLEERASYTELVDITDKNFRDTMESYKNSPADYVGRTDDVMSSLVSQCGREAKTTSMSDYASRIAERKARDAGKTASEAKAKAKNGKDRSE